MFPDAVTTRGQKHVRELLAMKKQGHRAVVLLLGYIMGLIVLKSQNISILNMILIKEAMEQGVEGYAYVGQFEISNENSTALSLTESVPI